jgi:hypothetical protein
LSRSEKSAFSFGVGMVAIVRGKRQSIVNRLR